MDRGRALNEMVLLELWADEKYVTNLDRINTHTSASRDSPKSALGYTELMGSVRFERHIVSC